MTHDSAHGHRPHRGGSDNRPHGRQKVDRGRGYKRVDSKHVEVYDLDMASWFHMRNVPISDACKTGREIVITFYDPEDEDKISKLSIDWLNSEAAMFASAVRQMKKVCWSTGRQR